MRAILLALIPLFVGNALADDERRLDVGGRERSYIVHVPEIAPDRAMPVVLIFHGGGGNARSMVRITAFNQTADKHGFLAVYPAGTGRNDDFMLTWNAGLCCGYAVREGVDDVAFVHAMLDDLARHYRVDPKRVYATGLSNGAMMSYRLALEMPERIAAIAPVGAAMSARIAALPEHATPVPVVHFHGTADEFAPMAGGMGKRSVARIAHVPVPDTIAWWVKTNGCDPTPVKTDLPDTVADDGTRVRCETYEPKGRGGAPVVLYVIEGGGHNWPGRPPIHEVLRLERRTGEPVIDFGPSTRDIDANEVIWAFLSEHSRSQ